LRDGTGLGLTCRLAYVRGSLARSGAEGAVLGRLPAWLRHFLFSLFFLLLSFPMSCELHIALKNEI
jgi:hypothetical protein